MTKSELIEQISEKLKLPNGKAEQIVNCIFDSMVRALQDGEGIEIRGFGSFTVREYKSYEGRNPRTGETVHVAPKRLPFFKVGKDLRERVNSASAGQGETVATDAATPSPPAVSPPAPSSSETSQPGPGQPSASPGRPHLELVRDPPENAPAQNTPGDSSTGASISRGSDSHPTESSGSPGHSGSTVEPDPGFAPAESGFAPASTQHEGQHGGSLGDPAEPHGHGSSASSESTPPGSTSGWD